MRDSNIRGEDEAIDVLDVDFWWSPPPEAIFGATVHGGDERKVHLNDFPGWRVFSSQFSNPISLSHFPTWQIHWPLDEFSALVLLGFGYIGLSHDSIAIVP